LEVINHAGINAKRANDKAKSNSEAVHTRSKDLVATSPSCQW